MNDAHDFSDDDDEPPILVDLGDVQPPDGDAPSSNVESKPSSVTNPTTTNVRNDEPTTALPPCPVTILSGFLGSGKTSLIQYILQSPDHGKRIAVIENEYGEELGIESLIARDGVDPQSSSLTDLIELPNGCVCCTVKDSLVLTLEDLLAKRSDLDYILIECSGMANPGPIASLFWLDSDLDSRLQLDGIVTLCDVVHIERQLRETQEAAQQIAYADRILLNKIDLLSQEDQNNQQIDTIKNVIRRFHPTVPIQETCHAKVPDLDWILDTNSFENDAVPGKRAADAEVKTWKYIMELNAPNKNDESPHETRQTSAADDNGMFCQPVRAAATEQKHNHTSDISTVSIVREGRSVDYRKLNRWLASILWPNQDEQDHVLRKWLEQQSENNETDFVQQQARQQVSSEEETLSSQNTQRRHVSQQQQQQTRRQQSIFRIKGILSVEHPIRDEKLNLQDLPEYSAKHVDPASGLDRRRFIVQGVHDLWEVHPSSSAHLEWKTTQDRSCKLVVIGRYLNRLELERGFESCCCCVNGD